MNAGGVGGANFFHMWWRCPKITELWKEVGCALSQVKGVELSSAMPKTYYWILITTSSKILELFWGIH